MAAGSALRSAFHLQTRPHGAHAGLELLILRADRAAPPRRAARSAAPGSGGAAGPGRGLCSQPPGPFVPAVPAEGGSLLRRRMRTPARLPRRPGCSPRAVAMATAGGNAGKTPLAARPRRPRGKLRSSSSRFPRTAWALGWRIPLVPRDEYRLAHARGVHPSPPHARAHTGKAQVRGTNPLRMRDARLLGRAGCLGNCSELPFHRVPEPGIPRC